MSELSRTVLGATEQISDAQRGLANIRAVNRERKKQAYASLGASFRQFSNDLKGYQSMQEKNRADAEIASLNDADALGRLNDDPAEAYATLQAARRGIKTRAAAEVADNLSQKWMKWADQRQKDTLAEARIYSAEQRAADANASRENIATLNSDLRRQIEESRRTGQIDLETLRQENRRETEKTKYLNQMALQGERAASAEKLLKMRLASQEDIADREFQIKSRLADIAQGRVDLATDVYVLDKWFKENRLALQTAGVERDSAIGLLRNVEHELQVQTETFQKMQAGLADPADAEGNSAFAETKGRIDSLRTKLDALKMELAKPVKPPSPAPAPAPRTPMMPTYGADVLSTLTPDEMKEFESMDADGQEQFLRVMGR